MCAVQRTRTDKRTMDMVARSKEERLRLRAEVRSMTVSVRYTALTPSVLNRWFTPCTFLFIQIKALTGVFPSSELTKLAFITGYIWVVLPKAIVHASAAAQARRA